MKSINKIVSSLLVACLCLGFTACTEKAEYDPATVPGNAQVYFSRDLLAKVALSQDLSVTSYDVELRRIDKTAALTVNLSVETEAPDIFTVPTSANFAAGSDVTKITITYDPSKLDYDEYKSISISVDAAQTSDYGPKVYAFTAGIPAPWQSLGKAKFSDTWMFEDIYEVVIQQHMLDPTRYRLVDPYTEGLTKEGYIPDYNKGNQSPYLEFKVLPRGSVHKDVTTTVDGLVVYDDIYTGYFHSNYGQEVLAMHPSRFTSLSTESSWLHNIVTQFSADGKPEVVQLAPYFYMMGVGGWNYTQNDGVVTIVFPGVVLADYAVEVSYDGRYTNADGEDFAIADVTLGADVEYAKVAMVSGGATQAGLNGVIDGSIPSVEVTASGKVQFPCPATGRYTFWVVIYVDGEAYDYNYVAFDFTAGN